MQKQLSADAAELLHYLAERDGQASGVGDDGAIRELVRLGLLEHTTIGVPEPLLTLTPAGRALTGISDSTSPLHRARP